MPDCYRVVKCTSLTVFEELKWEHVLKEHTLRDVHMRCPVEGCNFEAVMPYGQIFENLCAHLKVT